MTSTVPPPLAAPPGRTPLYRRVPTWVLLVAGMVVLAAMVPLSLVLTSHTYAAQDQANTANARSSSVASAAAPLAGGVDAACRGRDAAATQLQQQGLCQQASQVQSVVAAPGPATGPSGERGPAGPGVAATSIAGGHLFVTYTDGRTEDKGQVAGATGGKGDRGRSITSTLITGGHLVLSYDDGTAADVGPVVGRDGLPGRGVASTAITSAFHLLVTYTDGTTVDIGQLPAGASGKNGNDGRDGQNGAPGVSVTKQYFDRDSSGACRNYNDFSDGRTRVDEGPAGDTACPAVSVTVIPTT